MPLVIGSGYSPRGLNWREHREVEKIYRGRYPMGLDLRPGSELHDQILSMVLEHARESETFINTRTPVWDVLEEQLRVFIPASELEDRIKRRDRTKPISIVVPESYALRDTLLTYNLSVFGEDPLFRYHGVGPEDTLGAILMEKIVANQSARKKHLLACHTMWSDAYTYGFGVAAVRWVTEMAKTQVPRPLGFTDPMTGEFIETGMARDLEDRIRFEGNVIDPINPRNCLPDPNVPIYEVQNGEYFGWVERSNYYNLRKLEELGGNLIFNIQWAEVLGDGNLQSEIYKEQRAPSGPSGSETWLGHHARHIDVVWMYKEIIPRLYGWGDSDIPEKWLFGVMADQIIIAAHPMDLTHNMFPVVVCAPDYDGHTLLPISKLEIGFGLQETINYYFNTRMTAIRKMLAMRLIADPKSVNMKALLRGSPVIPTRQPVWGRGVDKLVEQLRLEDTTQGMDRDVNTSRDMFRTSTGVVDSIQGIQRQHGERVTASEFEATRGSALSRLQRAARITSLQAMQDLAYIVAHHTQQFITEESYISVAGRWEQDLRHEFGIIDPHISVSPLDLNINFDVEASDGSVEGMGTADSWIQFLQILGGSEAMMETLDMSRVLLHIARLLGVKNTHDFLHKAEPSVLPDQQVAEQAAAGNLVGVEDAI